MKLLPKLALAICIGSVRSQKNYCEQENKFLIGNAEVVAIAESLQQCADLCFENLPPEAPPGFQCRSITYDEEISDCILNQETADTLPDAFIDEEGLIYADQSCLESGTPAPPTPRPPNPPTDGPVTNPPTNPGNGPGTNTDAKGQDLSPNCCFWAQKNQCETNPWWMRVNCQKSCGSPTCNDAKTADKCPSTVSSECQANAAPSGYQPPNPLTNNPNPMPSQPGASAPAPSMNYNQPRSGKSQFRGNFRVAPRRQVFANRPQICRNYNVDCDGWAAKGDCFSNAGWMLRNCQLSCRASGCVRG